ncbi:hypothetical protein BDN70DRAFT_503976 [Pholiota conissans]|uniref:Mediator complex subunit 1 n=1 Tax=Pholiota conissans TaxID=109636 RepID=A0A9P5YP35_9AGAR|nr:hypothetical protein BDN70DRAFT_503976 [Pholiota conissans]
MQSNPPIQTLLSSLENFAKHDVFPQHASHPFATAAPESCGLLQDLINTTAQLSDSLSAYDASLQWTNPKLISLMRQHTNIEHSSQSSAKNLHHLIDVLSKRTGVSYGEDVPLLATSVPEWCIDQLKNWGTSVGMETFKEGSSTVVLGGKSLVIDVDFTISHENPLKPMLKVANVKTANALLPNSNSHTTNTNSGSSTSALLDAFLKDGIEKYCNEMQKDENTRDPQYAARLRRDVLDHLRYLVLLDGLASRKDDGGIRWFTDIDELWPVLNGLAKMESKVVASSLSLQKAPLDIFLLRGHSLPLPYLISPSISFLAYISPLVYLSLIRHGKADQTTGNNANDDLTIDVLLSDVRARLPTLTTGVTIATLSLEKLSEAHLYPPSMSMPSVTARPTFLLAASAADLDHSFPQLDGFGMEENSSPPFSWVLDFTAGGKRPGVIMSQSRMKFIELVVNPLGGDGSVVTDIMAFGSGSWVDQLLNPGNTASPERYTALYRSPNFLHPPLQLRLTAPEEPGFTLERIPVHSIKEIWGILEVVREQCWLNEILLGSHWTPEGLKSEEEDIPADDTTATEDELQALLSGTFVPRKIPVNVFLPTGVNATDNLFDIAPISGPKIVMTSPTRSPMSGLIEITVTHDESKPRGISVDVQGAMGYELKAVELEEICRRGGTLGLSGRVWASGGGLSR